MSEPDPDEADDLWAVARVLFEAGRAGETVCRDLGLAPSTFWRRAAEGGWLRRDDPHAQHREAPLDLSRPADDLEVAIDKAWRRACAALDSGDHAAAARWARVHAQFRATALAELRAMEADLRAMARQESLDLVARTESLARAARAELALVQAGGSAAPRPEWEKEENNFADSHAPLPDGHPDRPMNRAERRRQRRAGGP